MGHVRDLPKSTLGVDVDDNFAPTYLVPRDKSKLVKELKESVQKAREVYLATDPDREGEAIAWHLVAATGAESKPVRRVVFYEITPEAVKAAMANPREIDPDLVDAQQARRVLDRLVGYKVSPLLWKKVKRGLSAGRVQTAALRIVAERERDIAAFEPVVVGLPGGGSIALHGGGLATSSVARRRWLADGVPQNHLIDPRTGSGTTSPWRDVTVAAHSCLVADVAAKAALLLGDAGPDWLDGRRLAGRFVSHDGAVTLNETWAARAPRQVAA
jgi:hypothetical protein